MVSRLVEHAAGTRSPVLLTGIGRMIVIVAVVDVGAAVAGSRREWPRIARSRSVDGRDRCGAGNGRSHSRRMSYGFVAKFTLSGKALQVRHETQAHRILDVHPFHGHQVASHFRRAFTESNIVVVHGELVRVVSQSVQSYKFRYLID